VLSSCLAGQAQQSWLNLNVNQSDLTLNYRLSTTNEAFFIVNSTNLQSLFSEGAIFHAGFSSNSISGSITSSVLPFVTANFFTLSEYPDALPDDLEPPISDEESLNTPAYYFDVNGLPYPLAANVPIQLTIFVNDGDRNLQPVNGTLELTLLDGTKQTPSFPFTIISSTIPVTNGVGQGTITIQATNSLSACVLAAAFSPTSALGPKPLGNGPQPMNASANSVVALTPIAAKPLADYRDPDRNNWQYPLASAFPINGTFGEWPGHTDIHWGVDFLAPVNTAVRAAKRGVVTKVGKLTAAGNYQFVTLDHGNGCATRYLHIQPWVGVDDIVEAGDTVGLVAPKTWTGYDPHFHFEMMRNPSDVPGNYVYTRGVTYPFPLVNPINTNAIVFSPPLTTLDANPPEVKAVLITRKNPATTIYDPLSARTLSEAESDISIGYFLAQIVDDEGGKITPMDIHFFADDNPEQIVDYQSSPTMIRNFRTNPNTPGYARLPTAEFSSTLKNRRYKYWFQWDTSSYRTEATGPRTVRLEVNDVAGRHTTNHFTFGPQIKGGSVTLVGPQQYQFTLVAYLGTNTIPAFVQPDQYKLQILQSNGQPLPGVTWTPTLLAGDYTPVFTVHTNEAVYAFTLPGGEDPGGLKLRVSSRLATNIAHEICLCGGPDMAFIPAGLFTMGSVEYPNFGEDPVHSVYVSGFYMDKYEVTKALWDEVKAWNGGNGYSFDYADSGQGKAVNHPVHTMTWFDAVKWCNARSQKEGLTPCYYTDAGLTSVYKTGQGSPYVNWSAGGYRLPTEAEWEKAARGGNSGHRFPWSDTDTISHSRANYYGDPASSGGYAYDLAPDGFHPAYSDGVHPYTSPVGSFAANGYGLYDMAGNVWEWCWDWWSYYSSSPGTDPRGPVSGSYRVLRGGGWDGEAISCRSASRNYLRNPAISYSYIGFRCVRAAGQ